MCFRKQPKGPTFRQYKVIVRLHILPHFGRKKLRGSLYKNG
ncbi:hypothetical protein [Siminovitchia terrae]